MECSQDKFLRRFRLPGNAKVDQVRAAIENGVLTVTVPKEEVKKPEVKFIETSGRAFYIRPFLRVCIFQCLSRLCVFIEGLSRVKRCTNEGRALMVLDLQVLINGLQHFSLLNVKPKLLTVETFIKILYAVEMAQENN